jgi:hypothetical protein
MIYCNLVIKFIYAIRSRCCYYMFLLRFIKVIGPNHV